MITDRQHKLHWFFSHLADVLVVVLILLGIWMWKGGSL